MPFSIISFESLPSDKEEEFRLQVVTQEGDDAAAVTLRGGNNPLLLNVRLVIRPKYCRGRIDEFLLLTFRGQTQQSPVSMSSAQCTVGLRVQGTMMSPDEVKISRSLSAEATPFTPHITVTYFDQPCPSFVLRENSFDSSHGFRHITPPSACCLLLEARYFFSRLYSRAYRRAGEMVIKFCLFGFKMIFT